MQGDDNNAFLSQSREYRLPDKVQLLTEIVDLAIDPRGRRCVARSGRFVALQLHHR